MIDWDRVTELRSEIGAEGFAEVVDLFLDEVEAVALALGQKPGKLEDELHFLKGSALNLGFGTFGRLCQQGERLCANGQDAQVDVAAIISGYHNSKAEFMTRLAEFTTIDGSQIKNSDSVASSVMSR
ncbi:Hpt domain-containing protein [Thioclava sp. BHET1]|nr:Hpt domain-containing protein [Thioclava sp. BHET1]